MSDEISNLNIAVTSTTSNGVVSVGVIAFLARTVNKCIGQEQTIGTTAELLQMVSSVPLYVYIRNFDLVNYVTIDSVNTMNSFPQKIGPGRSISLCPETTTIYAKANGGSCKVWVISAY